MQWHVEIGEFDALGEFDVLCDIRYTTKFPCSILLPSKKATVTVLIFILLILFMLGDIELNPRPNKTNSSCKFLDCHWNLNNFAVHNFEKVGLLVVYNTINKMFLNLIWIQCFIW